MTVFGGPSGKKCQSSLIFWCKIPILCQSLAKSAQILLVMSDRTDKFRELWIFWKFFVFTCYWRSVCMYSETCLRWTSLGPTFVFEINRDSVYTEQRLSTLGLYFKIGLYRIVFITVHEIRQSCQTWPAKFGQILLKTDTRLVFYNRKLMRTDIFFH